MAWPAVEALLALRALAGEGPSIELVAPNPSLVYRPMRVTEPFEVGEVRCFALDRIAADQWAEFRPGALTTVDPEQRRARVRDGQWVPYDFLVVATGARSRNAVPGALLLGGPGGTDDMAGALSRARAGAIDRIAFALPAKASWPLPLYELALLTAWRLAEDRLTDVALTFVTPEQEPLGLFGPEASERVGGLLGARDIELHLRSRPERVEGGQLKVEAQDALPADRVFTRAGP